MHKYLFCFFILCLAGCGEKNEIFSSTIKGHLIESSSMKSLPDVKIILYDQTKVYSIAFSDADGMFSMVTPLLEKNHYYSLSFHWSSEYPAKTITLYNPPVVFDLNDFIVYDEHNPYDYKIWDSYMIHKTLPGLFTYLGAKESCNALRDGYDDWLLPPADVLDVLADEENVARQIAEEGWYWSSWVTNDYERNVNYYYGVNVLTNGVATTTNPYEMLKVLPIRRITE